MIKHQLLAKAMTRLAMTWAEETQGDVSGFSPSVLGARVASYIILFGHNDDVGALDFLRWIEETCNCTVQAGPSETHPTLVFEHDRDATLFMLRWE